MDDAQVESWYWEKRATRLIEKLEKKGFAAQYAPTTEQGRDAVLSLIPQGSTVGLNGGQTLAQIGVIDTLLGGEYNVINPFEAGLAPADSLKRRKQGLLADVMVSSTNAITEEGELVNVDGSGNRVAGMIFGPDKVVIAAGMNKVVPDTHEAWRRIKQYARPMNNARLELPNPCVETGFCHECNNKTRICNYYTVIRRSFVPGRICIVLIGANLGY